MSSPVDIIKEYLAEIGFKVDEKSVQAVNASFEKMQRVINSFMKGLSENKAFKAFSEGLEKIAVEAEKAAVIIGESVVGPIAAISTALVGLNVAVTAATAVFASKMAQMDLETKKFALSLFTTTQNARSLKSVMEAMGVNSLDDLKYVNLIPEQREQFLKLRQLASGLSLNGDQQQGMENIRKLGYEMQRFQVIFSYFWQKVAGTLGKLLEGPLKRLDAWLNKNSEKFAKSIDAYAVAMAQVLEYSISFTTELGKLIVNLSGLMPLMPYLNKFVWFIKLLADILLLVMRKINDPFGLNGKPFKPIPMPTGLREPGKWMFEKYDSTTYPHGTQGNHSFKAGIGVSPAILAALSQLDQNTKGAYTVTDGVAHRKEASYHPKGLAFDAVPKTDTISSWADLIMGMLATSNIKKVNLEIKGQKYFQIMRELERRHVDTNVIAHEFSKESKGQHVHATLKPVEVKIYVNGAKHPKETAMAVKDALQNVSLGGIYV